MIIKTIFIGLSMFIFLACEKGDDTEPTSGNNTKTQSTSVNKIMALGASRVEGDRPNFESFRYELWKDLKENNWLNQTGSPDIVLFSSPGGNDVLQSLDYNQTISNINAIIDALQANNPNVKIIIEQTAPARSTFMTAEYTNAFNNMQEDVLNIATNQSTTASQVIAVDMYTGFSDNLLADDVHYNEAGAEFIASRYYNVLQNELQR